MKSIPTTKTYTKDLFYDKETDSYLLNLPEELTAELGWEVGDTLIWTVKNNTIYLSKQTTETSSERQI